MDPKTVEKLEEKIEEAIAEVVVKMGLKKLPLEKMLRACEGMLLVLMK